MTKPILVLILPILVVAACRRAPMPVAEVVAVPIAALPTDVHDEVWQTTPEHVAKLLPQDLVEPRLQQVSTPEVRVRALAAGSEIALRLEWADTSLDDLPGNGRFPDGCAVQVPQQMTQTAPDPQMGQLGNGVEITYWRADWQATVNGRGDSIRDLFPNATVDHYPFEAPSLDKGSDAQQQLSRLYAPAAGAGNYRGGLRKSAVEDLVAEGPGTVSARSETRSRGLGVRTATGWVVLITRAIPAGFSPTVRSQVAFAIWQGSAQEAGARKMRTIWVPLSLRAAP